MTDESMSPAPGEYRVHGESVEINVADVIAGVADVNLDDVTLSATGVVLSEEQRSLLQRVLEKVLRVVHAVEVAVEVAPDGTVRVITRLRG